MKRKGQVFLIAALVIVSSLVILRASSFAPAAIEEREKFETSLENSIFQNFATELKNSVRYSLFVGDNITRDVHDFANFTKLKSAEHSFNLQVFFIGASANRTTNNLNVSVINLMGDTIDVNLTIDDKNQTGIIENYGRWDTNFTITPGTNYVMTAIYNTTTQNISIKTKANKDVFNSYFDITMIGDNSVHKDVDIAHYNLN